MRVHEIILEEPDFNYSFFNDREKELNKLIFQYIDGEPDGEPLMILVYPSEKDKDTYRNCQGHISAYEHEDYLGSYAIDLVKIEPEWYGTGLGQMLYEKMIVFARSKGAKYLYSDLYSSMKPPAKKAWERLGQRYQVEKERTRFKLTIPEKVKRIITKENAPDFGYTVYNNLDNEINKLTWKKISNNNGIDIWAESKPGTMSARIRSYIENDYCCIYSAKLLEPGWEGSGLGQMLYDKLISEAKNKGIKYLRSDYDRSVAAEYAWKKIRNRYPVKNIMYNKNSPYYGNVQYYRIDLRKVNTKEVPK